MPWYTVVGFRLETWERYKGVVEAASARGAEDAVSLECEREGGPIGVCGVFEGELINLDTSVWLLPDAQDQNEVDQARVTGGYELWAPEIAQPVKKKFWSRG